MLHTRCVHRLSPNMNVSTLLYPHRTKPLLPKWVVRLCFRALLTFGVTLGAAHTANAAEFSLQQHCPPSLELTKEGVCRLRSMYQAYTPIQGHGGVRVALPDVRDGFAPEQIDLGRHLFFDPLLSGDRKSSCAHCHHPDHGMADGLATGAGFGGEGFGPNRRGGAELSRRTPTLWNVAFATRLFWDGRAASLEEQATGPLFSEQEMGNTPERLERDLNANRAYRKLFAQAFMRTEEQSITVGEVARALAAFESTLISLNSRYDRYAHGDRHALTAREVQGMNVFRGFVARCTQCHTPPLFTNHELAVVGAPPQAKGKPIDVGASSVTHDPLLRGAFKVPTLRNITKTGPRYFNAGQFANLEEVVAFYNAKRGHALPSGEKQALHWHVHMVKPKLSKDDAASIVAFLGALEDETLAPVPPSAVPSGLLIVPVLAKQREPQSSPAAYLK